MAFLWPLSGEELKRLQREALHPVVFSGSLRKVRHLRPLRSRHVVPTKVEEEAKAVRRRLECLRWQMVTGEAERIASETNVNREKIALEVDAEQRWLNFGDAIRVMLPGLGEDGVDTCLSTCVRPGAAPKVGPSALVGSDARLAEQRLAQDLAQSGRAAQDFVALTLAADGDGQTLRRSGWTIYRANELDGFQGSQVHYGQFFLLGQPETTSQPTQEVLLSCEPPSREGGIGAAYQLMGRVGGFGHAAMGRTSWKTVFMLVPVADAQMGDVVDVHMGVRIVPLAPFSYVHGPRLMQAMYFGLPNRVGRGCVSRALKLADEREELLLHAARWPKRNSEGWWDAEWLLQPLMLPLEPCLVVPKMTDFARWDRLRSAILERLVDRQEVFSFSSLRKVLSKDRLLTSACGELLPPVAEALEPLRDQIVVPKSFVSATFQCSYGLYVSDQDLQLLVQCFGSEKMELFPCDEPVVNVDLFLDALRGETSIGRSRTLDQLYSLLLKQAGKPLESLSASWIQFHIEKTAQQRIRPKEIGQQFPANELMAALPLVRNHSAVTRHIFLRWQMDVLAFVHQHDELLHWLREIWGDLAMELLTEEEQFNWRLPVPQ